MPFVWNRTYPCLPLAGGRTRVIAGDLDQLGAKVDQPEPTTREIRKRCPAHSL